MWKVGEWEDGNAEALRNGKWTSENPFDDDWKRRVIRWRWGEGGLHCQFEDKWHQALEYYKSRRHSLTFIFIDAIMCYREKPQTPSKSFWFLSKRKSTTSMLKFSPLPQSLHFQIDGMIKKLGMKGVGVCMQIYGYVEIFPWNFLIKPNSATPPRRGGKKLYHGNFTFFCSTISSCRLYMYGTWWLFNNHIFPSLARYDVHEICTREKASTASYHVTLSVSEYFTFFISHAIIFRKEKFSHHDAVL